MDSKKTCIPIKTLPESARPRERLMEYGANSLPTYELLAIILRSGGKYGSAIQLAHKLLNHFEDLYQLKMAATEELLAIEGIGKAKAVELQAIFEFSKRLHQARLIKLGTIHSSQEAGDYYLSELADSHQEKVLVFYLNTKNEVIKKQIIFIGGLNISVAHPREIYKEAVRVSAARIMVGHNHPSGNPEPSPEDIEFTRRLKEAGKIIGVELLDHLVVGHSSFISLREQGLL
ncbi:RadC family protein [Aerococcus tenax]|uniref:RadC family protein n=1 Tax=Aerococcus tenax TaxID=3078812 RepID=UPI0018A6F5B3|nr:DNA repair protein RadC [Aerococcus tenax]